MGTNSKRKRVNKKQSIFIVIFLLTLPIIINSFYTLKDANKAITVQFENTDSKPFVLKTALTDQERKEGLMFVKELDNNKGMFFAFPTETKQSFWMKNTFISLDIIFVNKDFKVVGIVENTTPLSTKQVTVNEKSKYVIELLAGQVKENNIKVNDKVILNKKIGKIS